MTSIQPAGCELRGLFYIKFATGSMLRLRFVMASGGTNKNRFHHSGAVFPWLKSLRRMKTTVGLSFGPIKFDKLHGIIMFAAHASR